MQGGCRTTYVETQFETYEAESCTSVKNKKKKREEACVLWSPAFLTPLNPQSSFPHRCMLKY